MTISYDKLPMLFQSVLDIPMYEAVGALAHDIARPPGVAEDHTMTIQTCGWVQWPLSNLTILSFNPGNPDWLELSVANSVSMDYQVGDFSLLAWIYMDVLADRYVIERGLLNTDGWFFYVDVNGAITFVTNQGAANQLSASANGAVTIANWWCIGVTRHGASARIYRNGMDVTSVVGVHVNPAACARKLHVGIDDTEAANQWDGYIWRPIDLGRQLSSTEMWKFF